MNVVLQLIRQIRGLWSGPDVRIEWQLILRTRKKFMIFTLLLSFTSCFSLLQWNRANTLNKQIVLLMQSIAGHRQYQGLALDTMGFANLLLQLLESDRQLDVLRLRIERAGMQTADRSFTASGPGFTDLYLNDFNLHAVSGEMTLAVEIREAWDGLATRFVSAFVFAAAALGALLLLIFRQRQAVKFEIFSERERMANQIAHDILSPLSAMKLAATQIVRSPTKASELILSSIARIETITRDLRPGVRREASRVNYRSIRETIEELLAAKKSEFPDVRLRLEAPVDLPGQFAVDLGKLNRILSNLINNAAEAPPKSKSTSTTAVDREIWVRCAQSEGLNICVSDNGMGIEPEILAQLGGEGKTFGKEGRGSGLGLFDAKRTIESWGGRLRMESVVGQGTRVTLTLTLTLPQALLL